MSVLAARPARAIEPRRAAVIGPLRAALLAGAALGADAAFDPAERHVPLCPFHAVTGWLCPLCGSLRAADALAHLNLGTAIRDNALFVAALPVLLGWWLDWLLSARAGRAGRRPSRRIAIAVAVLAAGFTVVRNLPAMAALRPSP